MTALDPREKNLFKYFSVRPLIFLPLTLDRLIPAPLIIDKFPIFGFAGIKLGKFVALVVGCDVKGRQSLLATDDEGTLNNGIIFDAVNRGAAKDVLAGPFEAGEKSTYRRCLSISHQFLD